MNYKTLNTIFYHMAEALAVICLFTGVYMGPNGAGAYWVALACLMRSQARDCYQTVKSEEAREQKTEQQTV